MVCALSVFIMPIDFIEIDKYTKKKPHENDTERKLSKFEAFKKLVTNVPFMCY